MKLYWEERRSGMRLVLSADDDEETDVGLVRRTPRGFDAIANTMGYDPGRAQRSIPTLEEARDFVESFRPWELYGGSPDLEPEPEVRPFPGETAVS